MEYRHKAFKSPSKAFIRNTSYISFARQNSGSPKDFQALQITPCLQKRQPFVPTAEQKGSINEDLNQEISDLAINVQPGMELPDAAEGREQPQTTTQQSPEPVPQPQPTP